MLPGKTGNPEITSFHLNAACWLASRQTNIKISPGHS